MRVKEHTILWKTHPTDTEGESVCVSNSKKKM